MAMAHIPLHWKRTTPFQKNCQFMFENGEGMIERCDQSADLALYFDYGTTGLGIISLCHYHIKWQESIWNRRGEE